jgi:magnesium chelatase subunit H
MASKVDEDVDQNFIRKNALALEKKGIERPFSRLFSNPPGDFGSMVNSGAYVLYVPFLI